MGGNEITRSELLEEAARICNLVEMKPVIPDEEAMVYFRWGVAYAAHHLCRTFGIGYNDLNFEIKKQREKK